MGERYVDGEDPSSIKPGDARRWISLYGEMIDFKTQLLERMSRQLPHLSQQARKALDSDFKLLQTQLSRYRRRLRFWSEREADLIGLHVDEASMTLVFRSQRAALTRREFEVISVLLSRPGEPFAADSLLSETSEGDPEGGSASVQVIVEQLGKKLSDLSVPCEIVSVPERGYALVFHR